MVIHINSICPKYGFWPGQLQVTRTDLFTAESAWFIVLTEQDDKRGPETVKQADS